MANFDEAIPVVLENEGGTIDDPLDPGGLTRFGISQRSYPDLDIGSLTVDAAKALYRKDFWKFDGITSQPVATKLFDAYVNIKHTAIKWAQEITGDSVDGIYGPNTERSINLMDPVKFITNFRQWWVNYLLAAAKIDPVVAEDLNGLLRRAKQ